MAKGQIPWNKGISTKALGKSRPKTRWVKYICQVCEKSFFDYPSKKRLVCSRLCTGIVRANKTRGEKHYRWKGGITPSDKVERMNFRILLHKKILERDCFTCSMCSIIGGDLQVDHIKKWSEYPELRFDIDNCRTLCMACHYKITFNREMPTGTIWGHNLSKRITS